MISFPMLKDSLVMKPDDVHDLEHHEELLSDAHELQLVGMTQVFVTSNCN